MFSEPQGAVGVDRKRTLPADWTSPWRFMTAVRSLLVFSLMCSGAFASRLEAGPAAFPDVSEPAVAVSVLARPALDSQILLAQRVIDPPGPNGRVRSAGEKETGRKNPAVAGLLSAAIPGAGQLYNGSSLGYLFLGIEAAAWISHVSMHETGMDKQDQFKGFADAHWSWDRYRDPTFEDCPTDGHSDGGVQDSTLQMLYDRRRDDYYEDIGKLSIYACGWDNQRNRDEYRDMRDDSNDFLRNARYATTVVFLNHLVSALHAARGAARHNARLAGNTEIDLKWSMVAMHPAARLRVSRTF